MKGIQRLLVCVLVFGGLFTTSALACTYEVSPSEMGPISSFGEVNGIWVYAASGCGWTAASNDSWIHIISGSPGSGNGIVGYRADPNPGPPRTGTITVQDQSFRLSQQGSASGLELSTNSLHFGSATSEMQFRVTNIVSYDFGFVLQRGDGGSCRAPDVRRLETTPNTGHGVLLSPGESMYVTVTIIRDPAQTTPISGCIRLDADYSQYYVVEITIDPLGDECTYALSEPDQTAPAAGSSEGEVHVTVMSGSGCSWVATSNKSWLHITSGPGGTGNGTVTYTVDPNAGAARSGTLSIAELTFTVNQLAGGGCTYSIAPTHEDGVSALGATGSVAVTVTSGSGCSWTATSNKSWLHITSGGSGTTSGAVGYSVDLNTGSARSGTLTIADQAFTVNQAGGGCTYSIDPTHADDVSKSGATGTVVVTVTGSSCSWTASSNKSWLHITSGASGSMSGDVGYSVDPNTGSARSSTLTIAGKTFTVNQLAGGGGGCTYFIDPTHADDVSKSGATGTVDVTVTGSGCSWTASSNKSWLHITSGDSGSTSGEVGYSVDPNTGSARSGTLTVAGKPFTVNQQTGVGCSYSIASPLLTLILAPTLGVDFPFSGGSVSVGVTTGPGCSWTATSPCGWVTVSPTSGTGSGTVTVSAGENIGDHHSCTVVIANQILAVSQSGARSSFVANAGAASDDIMQYYGIVFPVSQLREKLRSSVLHMLEAARALHAHNSSLSQYPTITSAAAALEEQDKITLGRQYWSQWEKDLVGFLQRDGDTVTSSTACSVITAWVNAVASTGNPPASCGTVAGLNQVASGAQAASDTTQGGNPPETPGAAAVGAVEWLLAFLAGASGAQDALYAQTAKTWCDWLSDLWTTVGT